MDRCPSGLRSWFWKPMCYARGGSNPSLSAFVRITGLEPVPFYKDNHLKVARLPFRQIRATFEPGRYEYSMVLLYAMIHKHKKGSIKEKNVVFRVGGFEPPKCRDQNPMPYHLATPYTKERFSLQGLCFSRVNKKYHNYTWWCYHTFWCNSTAWCLCTARCQEKSSRNTCISFFFMH